MPEGKPDPKLKKEWNDKLREKAGLPATVKKQKIPIPTPELSVKEILTKLVPGEYEIEGL